MLHYICVTSSSFTVLAMSCIAEDVYRYLPMYDTAETPHIIEGCLQTVQHVQNYYSLSIAGPRRLSELPLKSTEWAQSR